MFCLLLRVVCSFVRPQLGKRESLRHSGMAEAQALAFRTDRFGESPFQQAGSLEALPYDEDEFTPEELRFRTTWTCVSFGALQPGANSRADAAVWFSSCCLLSGFCGYLRLFGKRPMPTLA